MDYKSAGVNVEKGDSASKKAYTAAKTTFSSRKGRIGQPFALEGGYSGALDMGDFLMVQNDDGTGTKSEIAEDLNDFSTLGIDLLAMVADDAICVGAEVISMTNTIDTPKVNPVQIEEMTQGLANACQKERIVMAGGEIAELGNALNRMVWNATAVGIVKKDRFITGKDIKEGDSIIALKGNVLRSNGFSLARAICKENFGQNWVNQPFQDKNNTETKEKTTWGKVLLTPCKIYHRTLLNIMGDFENPKKHAIKGLCHVTGGGIPGNLNRILPSNMGASLQHLHEPHKAVKELQNLGNVNVKEAYKTWFSGSAMLLVVQPEKAKEICQELNKIAPTLAAKIAGKVINQPKIIITNKYEEDFGKELEFLI